MKVIVSSTVLNQQLQVAGRILQKKNPMPILEGFLIESSGGKLTITASNSQNSLITTLPTIEQVGEGKMCINAQTLLNAVKKIPEQPLTLEYNEEFFKLNGKHGGGNFNIVGYDANLFPNPIPVSECNVIEIPSKYLLAGVSECFTATVQDDVMPFKSGIFFEVHKDHLIMVATDGRKLVKKMLPDVASGIEGHFMLPREIAAMLGAVIKKDCQVKISFDGQRATMTIGDTVIYFRLIETRYPRYNDVIPKNCPISVSVDRAALIASLERIGVFCDKSSGLVRMELKDGKLVLTGEDSANSSSAEEHVACEYSGEPFRIGFGYWYFIEILSVAQSEKVRLEMTAPERPCLIKPETEESDDLTMILMPMMIQ